MVEQTADRVGKALGRIPSGCSIVTARSETGRSGMLASWIQQAGFDPPIITVAIRKGRPIDRLIDETGAFVVNILGENPSEMFRHFGQGFSADEDAFAGLSVENVENGVVIEDQIAWLGVEVQGKYSAGDHWLYVAEVMEAGIEEVLPPYVHVRKDGMSY